jgi:triacylglycerol lipase
MNVVMVHGFGDTGRLFGPLLRRLESEGHACHAPTFRPRDGGLGIPDLSGKLASLIDGLGPGIPLALVGFSMGALVARHYLQARGGAARATAFFSIAGPHAGTYTAYGYPGIGTRQMRPHSAFLRELNAGTSCLGGLTVFTYRTPLDLMVWPGSSTRIAGAPELRFWCPLHTMLPSFPGVMDHISSRLATPGC